MEERGRGVRTGQGVATPIAKITCVSSHMGACACVSTGMHAHRHTHAWVQTRIWTQTGEESGWKVWQVLTLLSQGEGRL